MKLIIKSLLILFLFLPAAVFSQEQVDAIIDWAHRVDLTIPVDGVVKSVNVNTGQKIKKGTVLARLDARILQARLVEAKEKVKGLKASYQETNRELLRANELYDRTVLSDHDLQVAKNNSVIAKAALAAAESAYVKAKVDLEYSTLTAPFDSIVLKRNVEVGQAILNNLSYDALITLASSNTFLARARLTHEQSGVIKIGQNVTVSVDKKDYTGRIVAIEYGENTKAPQFVLVVEFDSEGRRLHAGSPARITF